MTPGLHLRIVDGRTGETRDERFTQNEITFGCVAGNDVVLTAPDVGKRHARLVVRDGKAIVVDLKSGHGTRVDGKALTSPMVLDDRRSLAMGPYLLRCALVPDVDLPVRLAPPASFPTASSPPPPRDAFGRVAHDDDDDKTPPYGSAAPARAGRPTPPTGVPAIVPIDLE